jgi:hypothetical protein
MTTRCVETQMLSVVHQNVQRAERSAVNIATATVVPAGFIQKAAVVMAQRTIPTPSNDARPLTDRLRTVGAVAGFALLVRGME